MTYFVEVNADSLNEAAIREQTGFVKVVLPYGSTLAVTICQPEVTYEVELGRYISGWVVWPDA